MAVAVMVADVLWKGKVEEMTVAAMVMVVRGEVMVMCSCVAGVATPRPAGDHATACMAWRPRGSLKFSWAFVGIAETTKLIVRNPSCGIDWVGDK